jgi:hypothetical protein
MACMSNEELTRAADGKRDTMKPPRTEPDILPRQVPGRPGGSPPPPPQTRTCPIKASGSSDMTLLPCTIHWSFVDTVGELKVSPVVPPSEASCPASPSLPWVPWVSVPHALRYYSRLRLPVAHPGRFARRSRAGTLWHPYSSLVE